MIVSADVGFLVGLDDMADWVSITQPVVQPRATRPIREARSGWPMLEVAAVVLLWMAWEHWCCWYHET